MRSFIDGLKLSKTKPLSTDIIDKKFYQQI